MNEQLPFFNLSLKKVLALEPDPFKKAKIKIVLTILVFSVIKALIVVPVAIEYAQYRQLFRALLVSAVLLSMIKVLLYRPSRMPVISHIMLLTGTSVVWSNLFLYSQDLNILTVQLVFMVSLSAYYLLGGRQAAIYTLCAILPVILFMLMKEMGIGHWGITVQKLAMPGFDIIVVLNFVTFIMSNYLFYQAFYQNLKEKELLNQQLQVNILEAKALAESRSVFLSTMSHELRTPLNGVIGMTNLLKDNAVDEQKDYLNILEFSATNLLSMINDVLDYNKSELDKIELEDIPVNLAALLQKIGYGLEMKALEKGLSWKLEVDDVVKHHLVITDPTRLTQIIYNLAGNAIKFTENGIVVVNAVVLNQNDNQVKIKFSITDTGIGISSDRQEAIFDPFVQASTDTTRKYGGSGLGLAIVKRLLKLFDSDIKLESQVGKGSVFSFIIEFPLYRGALDTVDELKMEKTSMKGLKLLIAEDNRINVLVLEKLLSKWDIQTIVAANGQEALNKLADQDFDAVLMDIHMPVMDGYAASLAIRALGNQAKANIPIIALTASVSHNVHTKIKEAGMQDYVAKPFQTDLLYEKLQQIYKGVN